MKVGSGREEKNASKIYYKKRGGGWSKRERERERERERARERESEREINRIDSLEARLTHILFVSWSSLSVAFRTDHHDLKSKRAIGLFDA